MESLQPAQFDKDSVALALREALESQQAIDRVVPDELAQDVDLAYGVQEVNTVHWLAAGRKLIGRKIGLTSEAVQDQLGVDQPDYGMLFDDMLLTDGDAVPPGVLIQPKAEAEVAFIMGSDVSTPLTSTEDAAAAVEFAVPAIEIVDSRIKDWKINLGNTIADNASSGLFVLGAARVPLSEVVPAGVHMEMYREGEIVSAGRGTDCLGDPLFALVWLANKMIKVGRPLARGDIVLSGALGPMVSAKPGDVMKAEIAGLGSVTAQFGK